MKLDHLKKTLKNVKNLHTWNWNRFNLFTCDYMWLQNHTREIMWSFRNFTWLLTTFIYARPTEFSFRFSFTNTPLYFQLQTRLCNNAEIGINTRTICPKKYSNLQHHPKSEVLQKWHNKIKQANMYPKKFLQLLCILPENYATAGSKSSYSGSVSSDIAKWL